MAKIIEKHDNDKIYIFTCPICGTKFTERERHLREYHSLLKGDYSGPPLYNITCPNCERTSPYRKLEEYNDTTEPKD